MHHNKGHSIAQCLRDRTDYVKNPDKTRDGELISSYECDPKTVDAEFLFSKRQYNALTGRQQKNNVIAYQVRQSFKPGEITPEEANRVGYEFAERFLKGKYAFIVATHIDRAHVHNHIIWNSTSLDCKRKFRDFWRSGKAVRRLSDLICIEHGLSVVEHPKRRGKSYDQWLGEKAQLSHREKLRLAMDEALDKQPAAFDELLSLLEQAGYEVKRGKHIALRGPGEKKFTRLSSMKRGYTENDLRAVLAGEQSHTPQKKRAPVSAEKPNLLIDIQAKLQAGKGAGYAKWAAGFNLKQMAQTLNFLTEHGLLEYDALAKKTQDAAARYNDLSAGIKSAEARMAEIAVLKTHIQNYARTRDVYAAYRKAGYSKKFLAEHEGDILLHKAAKKAFDELGVKKLPTVKSLQAEYAALLAEKKKAYGEYRAARDAMRELSVHKSNVERILNMDAGRSASKEKEHNGR